MKGLGHLYFDTHLSTDSIKKNELHFTHNCFKSLNQIVEGCPFIML